MRWNVSRDFPNSSEYPSVGGWKPAKTIGMCTLRLRILNVMHISPGIKLNSNWLTLNGGISNAAFVQASHAQSQRLWLTILLLGGKHKRPFQEHILGTLVLLFFRSFYVLMKWHQYYNRLLKCCVCFWDWLMATSAWCEFFNQFTSIEMP